MKKKIAVILSFLLIVTYFAMSKSPTTGEQKRQVLRMASSNVTNALDPAIAQETSTFTILGGLFEGLVRLDESGQVVPAMAKSWKISNDGLTYTFKLRSNIKWSNKQRVKASDFEFSWKRTLEPATQSIYAYNMYPIANAKAFNSGKLKDASKVGVKALNQTTLQVTLGEPTSFFLQTLADPIFLPLPETVVKANKNWASKIGTIVSNGPFKLKEWQKAKRLVLVKNPTYYDAEKIQLTEVQFTQYTSQISPTIAYVNGEVDFVGSDLTIDFEKLTEVAYKDYKIFPQSATYYYQFNMNKAPFTNLKIRQALAMGLNREVIGYGAPAYGFVPHRILGIKDDFRSEFTDNYFKEDINKAKLLLQEGLKEEELTELPQITLITNTGSHVNSVEEIIVSAWKENLGVDVDIEVQEWEELLDNRMQQNFQLARASWGADYNDPASFLEYFTSWSSNNDSGWNNSTYDQYVKQARSEINSQNRNLLYAKAEKLLIEQMVILPVYYYEIDVLQKSKLKGMQVNYMSTVDFSRAYFE
ncbi:peptide ABC transporter substrate-binding protein [Paenibacillus sp. GSMTC-2017]|uniref:peptide ABC transporter substrate-binding protein n=1 Tax=Paenibacillus sp. GSMTC-2017 TaxID=2794350 RepID=UPI0018D703A7|nr:peptide ABC transporter substrate-binding protein [Paenibacillus sp. GSMTC-2017]MBH5316548.1 peptide ABC transporter substrate-binding protein [Paenibacillus sp. GSMTC-2017]